MRHLQEAVQFDIQPEDSPAATLGPEAVRMRPLPSQVHPIRPPEAAQAIAHERKAVYVSGLQQEVHQRVRP